MGGGKGGGGDTSSSKALEQIAEDLFKETRGLRAGTIERLEDTLGGEFPAGPVFEGQKLTTEQAFDRARESVISQTPAGGALTGALTDVETARAGTLAGITTDIFQRDLQAAQGAAFGAPQISIAGLGSAAGTQAQLAQAQAAGKGGLGAGVGTLGAAALLK